MTMVEKTWPIAEKLIFNALQVTEQLHQQLIHEANILKNPSQTESINTIATHKKQLVMQLEQFNRQYGQILATEKLLNNPEGVKEYFQRATVTDLSTAEAIRHWARIQLLCSECRTLNEQNGASIELLASHAKRSLHILKGQTAGPSTYGPDGIAQSNLFTHTLALA